MKKYDLGKKTQILLLEIELENHFIFYPGETCQVRILWG